MTISKRIEIIEQKLDKVLELSIKSDNTLNGKIGLCQWIKKQEDRIKSLEKWRYKIIGASTIISAFVGIIINKYF